ncbi:MAG: hypothetical protein ACRD8Z_06435 [Nitrososphaeraceae archaeon]
METVKHDIAYDLPLKKTNLSFYPVNTKSEINNIKQTINHVYFVICNSCYWCASYFGTDNAHLLKCHDCSSSNTEPIPIATDESFRIEYDHIRGMEIKFYKSNK